MSYIETHPLEHNTIQSIYSERDAIVMAPPYQRNGDIWSKEKKQLLIDSIINRYDIPKMYFHRYERAEAKRLKKQYAIIDGRQRIETIFQFIENGFELGKDFDYLEDDAVDAAGMNYDELARAYPKIKSRFDSFSLPIITVDTDDIELIEDMFSRLNEAVPLNAAEKRRAFHGDMVKAIDEVSLHPFFTKRVRFSNKRYQHKEVAVRLLFIAHNLNAGGQVIDTKKPFLDRFTSDFKSGKAKTVNKLKEEVTSLLDDMASVFTTKDALLTTQSSVPVYVFVYRQLADDNLENRFTRSRLVKFDKHRADNREIAEQDITQALFDFLEFDRLSQQGTNDASSLRERWRILKKWLKA